MSKIEGRNHGRTPSLRNNFSETKARCNPFIGALTAEVLERIFGNEAILKRLSIERCVPISRSWTRCVVLSPLVGGVHHYRSIKVGLGVLVEARGMSNARFFHAHLLRDFEAIVHDTRVRRKSRNAHLRLLGR